MIESNGQSSPEVTTVGPSTPFWSNSKAFRIYLRRSPFSCSLVREGSPTGFVTVRPRTIFLHANPWYTSLALLGCPLCQWIQSQVACESPSLPFLLSRQQESHHHITAISHLIKLSACSVLLTNGFEFLSYLLNLLWFHSQFPDSHILFIDVFGNCLFDRRL